LEKIENQRQYISERFKDMASSEDIKNDEEGTQKLLKNQLL
jgi:hypothetical protein